MEEEFIAKTISIVREFHGKSKIKRVIIRWLKQFNLASSHSPEEILNEAYSRGIRKIRDGYFIKTIPAWYKSTCLNIIREISRKERKNIEIQKNLSRESPLKDNSSSIEGDEINIKKDIDKLAKAMGSLNPTECRIIQLYRLSELSWKEVTIELIKEGMIEEDKVNKKLIDKIRKQGQRIFKKLKDNYKNFK